MSDPTIPPSNPTISTLADEVRDITSTLKKSTLNPDQWNNLNAKFLDLEIAWNKPDFLISLHAFLFGQLQSGEFETWMSAFDKLRKKQYRDPDLKGFLISVNTTKTYKLDFTDYKIFKGFIIDNSDITLDEHQRILFRQKEIG
jgi:hypothetical protein